LVLIERWKKEDASSAEALLPNVTFTITLDMVQYAKNATIKFHNKTFYLFILDLFEIKTYNKAYIF